MHLDHLTRKETLPEQAKRLGVTDIDFTLIPIRRTTDNGNRNILVSWEYMEAGCDDAVKSFHNLIERLLKWHQ